MQRALDLVLELGELPAQLLPALFRRHRLELLGRDAKKAPHQPHDLAAHPCAQRFPARFRTLDCGARKPRKIERIGSMPAQIGPRKIDRQGTSRNRRYQGQRAASCFAPANEHEQKRRRIRPRCRKRKVVEWKVAIDMGLERRVDLARLERAQRLGNAHRIVGTRCLERGGSPDDAIEI